MAHEKREKFFDYLRMKLGDVKFSIDKDGPENIGVWRNCRRSWLMHDPQADYHIVVQDDAIVCNEFTKRATEFIERTSDGKNKAYQFYFGNRKALKHFADVGYKKGYIEDATMWWGVAICLPVKLIPEMIKFCDQLKMKQDDVRIRTFLLSKGIKVCYPMPSLIDHRTGEESLVGDPGKGRKAFYFIDQISK